MGWIDLLGVTSLLDPLGVIIMQVPGCTDLIIERSNPRFSSATLSLAAANSEPSKA